MKKLLGIALVVFYVGCSSAQTPQSGMIAGAIVGQIVGGDTKSTLTGAVIGGAIGSLNQGYSGTGGGTRVGVGYGSGGASVGVSQGLGGISQNQGAFTAAGALIGQGLGNDTRSTLIGAGIGAVVGGIIDANTQPVQNQNFSNQPQPLMQTGVGGPFSTSTQPRRMDN